MWKYYTTYSITYKCFTCIKNISLYKSTVICTDSNTQDSFIWERLCGTVKSVLPSSDGRPADLHQMLFFFFCRRKNCELAKYITYGEHGRLVKEYHRVSKLYKCTKAKSDDGESVVESLLAAVAVFHHGWPTCTCTKLWRRSSNCAGRYYTDVCFINTGNLIFLLLLENVCPYNIQGTVMTVWKGVWPGDGYCRDACCSCCANSSRGLYIGSQKLMGH